MPHGSHCCKKHGCKYGHDDCPVVLGTIPQQYKQECCEMAETHLSRSYKEILEDMRERNITSLTISEIETIIKSLKESDYW